MELENATIRFPRISISYCTQCKWLLRAAYFAQELLSTFSESLGEVSLIPTKGGTFLVEIHHSTGIESTIQKHIIWDRKAEGGFPETKELKRRVRDIIDPTRNLGHVDGHSKPPVSNSTSSSSSVVSQQTEAAPKPTTAGLPIPKAINRLQSGEGQVAESGERKFTPMDVDVKSRQASSSGEVINERGKIVIGEDGGMGYCRPGDEDCG